LSRIEKALEKAAELKEKNEAIPSPGGVEDTFGMPRIKDLPSTALRKGTYVVPPPYLDISHPLVVTFNDPKSQISEDFRKLKTCLVDLKMPGAGKKTFMVTSSLGGEGKSITTINLAITLAQEFDHTVLLIDADLRKPTMHRLFNLKPGVGLSDCLSDGVEVGTALIKTGIGKLSLLPAGREVENPAELLGSERMKYILAEMRDRYPDRVIIIDAPPVLPVAETRILGSLVDGVIFVIKEGAVAAASIYDALDSISREKVVGLVYNHLNPNTMDGRRHSYNREY
jgi:exopolysaccharide/PEP-CTERM locus tyrosine autokinase